MSHLDISVPRRQGVSVLGILALVFGAIGAQGVPHELHIYEGAGHGFAGLDLIDRFERSDRFLRKHLDKQ